MSTEPTSESPAFVDCSTDSLFDVLADARRRYVLAYLRGTESAAPRDELADAVVAWENGPGAEPTESVRENVAISLHHRHLPKLEQTGLTERTADGVSLTERGVSAFGMFSAAPSERMDESSSA